MSTGIKVAVIGGGRSEEHDVSRSSAHAFSTAAREAGYTVTELVIGRDGIWQEVAFIGDVSSGVPTALGETVFESVAAASKIIGNCDVAVPMMHGPHGEDGELAAFFDLLDVPFVGSGLGASAVGIDKWVSKLVAAELGVATAAGVLLTPDRADEYEFTHPVVVKPVTSGSSHGVSLVQVAEELAPALEHAFAIDSRILAEEVMKGQEVDVAVLQNPDGSTTVGPPLEIVSPGIFDYETKYGGTADFKIPAGLPEEQLEEIKELAQRLFVAFGCRGVARVDFFVTEKGLVFNEINTIPGMTPASQVPRIFTQAGISYPELSDRLIQGALTR